MKKTVCLILAILMLSCFFCACQQNYKTEETHSTENSTNVEENIAEKVETDAEEAAVKEETDTGEEKTITPSGTIKILAIGNSFSVDCMQYLWDIMRDAGYDTIILGNLYHGGCSLEQHLTFASQDRSAYTYYKNTQGTWTSTTDYKLSTALADEEWDYISFQQASKACGLRSSYGENLTKLVDYVAERVPKDVKFIWNMTWAYQQDSTHPSFPNYDSSQAKMYDMIIDCMKNCIQTENRFSLIIPCMTSIQNARTSFLEDTLTRDGFHLDYYIGRYIAGLTWYVAISGASLDLVTYNPSASNISEDMVAVAKESVQNAISNPLVITNSKITTGSRTNEK